MKNTLGDLNNYLFETLERLNDHDLKGEELKEEMERSKAIGNIAKTVIENAALVLRAQTVYDDMCNPETPKPKMLGAE